MKNLKFEQAIKALEDMVEKMERGDLSLEDSLATFEKGMELAKICDQKLKEAQGRIEVVVDGKREARHDEF